MYLSLLGNGIIGMSLSGNRYLYISDGESLSIKVPYESLLTFTVDQKRSQRGNKCHYHSSLQNKVSLAVKCFFQLCSCAR